MPELTPLSNRDSTYNVLEDIRKSVILGLIDCFGPVVHDWKSYVAWAEPPQDCCPEVAVWATNIMPDPQYQVGTGSSPMGCTNFWKMDVTVRVAQCYVDMDEHGKTLDEVELSGMSQDMYAILQCAYYGWFCRYSEGTMNEIGQWNALSLGGVQPYADGGCGGAEYTVSISFVR